MKTGIRRAFAKNESGAATIEFVAVFFFFISMMMFVVELTIYQFMMASLEKAAEAGVRYAVVSSPAANSVAMENNLDGDDWGDACAPTGGSCGTFTKRTCTGRTMSGCRGAQLDNIIEHMRRFNGSIERENVTVTYENTGIGFAGGPSAPLVTVSIDRVQFKTGVIAMLIGNEANGLRTLPRRAASMTGEDMAQ